MKPFAAFTAARKTGPDQGRRHKRKCGNPREAREAADHPDETAGDEVHRIRQRRTGHAEIEIARDGEIRRQRRVLQVRDPLRPDARFGETVVQIRRDAIAKVVADRGLDGRQHLQQHEDHAGHRQRRDQAVAALHGGDEEARRNREQRRQEAPGPGKPAAGAGGCILFLVGLSLRNYVLAWIGLTVFVLALVIILVLGGWAWWRFGG